MKGGMNLDRPGYFRFSKLMDKVSYLDFWFNYFCQKGIPCFIAIQQYPFGYVLWRKGKDAHIKRDDPIKYDYGDEEIVKEWPEP